MAITLTYAGDFDFNNAKMLLFKATFTGVYGVLGVGDLLNLAPVELGSNPTGVTDPSFQYNNILGEPPKLVGVFSENMGGSYTQPQPNAAPSLANWGLRIYEPGGTEKATGAAYTAAELAGNVVIMVPLPIQ